MSKISEGKSTLFFVLLLENSMIKVAIFLSGTGSNARNICGYFAGHPQIEIALLLTNKPDSGAVHIARDFNIPYFIFNRSQFYESGEVLEQLDMAHIDAIILAGFLWLVPKNLLQRFPQRIINIHPALLPGYGGKGMYGMKVHESVHQHKETESGITIHLCNDKYDEGDILFQAKCKIETEDTPETIAKKVHELEYEFFPTVIEEYLTSNYADHFLAD
jgi:phosphoribosylglycinamide formyltransferase-1